MRRFAVVVAVLALVGLTSGCSLREVQLWFAINKKQTITRDQARTIADAVNAKKAPGGCDGNYTGGCVPDNATTAHCAGTAGDGVAVRGPLTVTGWDSFELDTDGDKYVCADPVGNLELFGQQLDQVVVSGWTFDPSTTNSIDVDVVTDGTANRITADGARPDVAAAYPGAGTNHGFSSSTSADPGTSRTLCVKAINNGVGADATLGCKLVTMLDIGEAANGDQLTGLLEGADRVPGGVHLRGFVLQTGPVTLTVGGNDGPDIDLAGRQTVARPDVDAALSTTGAMGFDFVATTAQIPVGAAWACIEFTGLGGTGAGSAGNLSCRALDT
jgi:hypothetical protein